MKPTKHRIFPTTLLRASLLLCMIPAGPTALFAQEPASGKLSLWGMIQQGGWAMYPLGLCSLIMFFLIFHSWRETHPRRFIPSEGVEEALSHLGAFRIQEGIDSLKRSQTVLGRIMEKALRRIKPEVPQVNKPKAEATLIEHLEAEENSVGQWVNYLNVVGSVSPMIGLLGTVSGMISAFQTIGQGGMGRPELLANDIGEALITTAAGLIVGIPAMLSFFIMRNRLTATVVATSQLASDLLDEIPVNVIFEEESPDTPQSENA